MCRVDRNPSQLSDLSQEAICIWSISFIQLQLYYNMRLRLHAMVQIITSRRCHTVTESVVKSGVVTNGPIGEALSPPSSLSRSLTSLHLTLPLPPFYLCLFFPPLPYLPHNPSFSLPYLQRLQTQLGDQDQEQDCKFSVLVRAQSSRQVGSGFSCFRPFTSYLQLDIPV